MLTREAPGGVVLFLLPTLPWGCWSLQGNTSRSRPILRPSIIHDLGLSSRRGKAGCVCRQNVSRSTRGRPPPQHQTRTATLSFQGIEIELSASFMIHLSLVTTTLSVAISFLLKYLDKLAAGESFVFQFYESMTAYINWLPHQGII